MAVLRSLKQKNRAFTFEAFGNVGAETPAKIVFSRFPLPDETYPLASQKAVLDSAFVRELDGSATSKERLVDHVINTMVDNMTANRVDLQRFFGECVERIDDLSFDGRDIKTRADFFAVLPEEAAYAIALEAYAYAKESDVFSVDEKKSSKSDTSSI